MEFLPFGQPLGAIMMIGYIVKDLDAALEHWTGRLKVGPFFIHEHFAVKDAEYRGQPAKFDCNLALAYSGNMCISLIMQNDEMPSIYQEVIKLRGYGLNHLALSTRDFDADVARYRAKGSDVALYGVAGVGARLAYMDTLTTHGALTELIEVTPQVENFFNSIRQASVGWQGDKPIRSQKDL